MKRYLQFIFQRQKIGYQVILFYAIIFSLANMVPFFFVDYSLGSFFGQLQGLLFNVLLVWLIVFGIYVVYPSVTTLYVLGGSRKETTLSAGLNTLIHSTLPALILTPSLVFLFHQSEGQGDLLSLFGRTFGLYGDLLSFLGNMGIIFLICLFFVQIVSYFVLIFTHFKVIWGLTNIAFFLSGVFLLIPFAEEFFVWGTRFSIFLGVLSLVNVLLLSVNSLLIYRLEINR